MEKDYQCAYCQYSNLPAHFHRLISVSFSPFRVSNKKTTLIRLCTVSPPGPVGIWCKNDVISASLRRHHVASTLLRRHFHVMCPLGLFMHNMPVNWRATSCLNWFRCCPPRVAIRGENQSTSCYPNDHRDIHMECL